MGPCYKITNHRNLDKARYNMYIIISRKTYYDFHREYSDFYKTTNYSCRPLGKRGF